jgi:hypothetical protein
LAMSTAPTRALASCVNACSRSRETVQKHAIESIARYFEVATALEKEPTNRELRREFNQLKGNLAPSWLG